MNLGEIVKVISHSKRNIFPVVHPETNVLMGVVLLDEVRNIMFRPELYGRFTARQLMISPPATINENLPMEKVMTIFEDSGAWNLPVVDNQKRYVGYVSKSKIFNSYRHVWCTFRMSEFCVYLPWSMTLVRVSCSMFKFHESILTMVNYKIVNIHG
jgi:CIC family chloride channel protein